MLLPFGWTSNCLFVCVVCCVCARVPLHTWVPSTIFEFDFSFQISSVHACACIFSFGCMMSDGVTKES
jgi:hypothetical protein